MVGITIPGESNSAKKIVDANYILRRERRLDLIDLLLQNSDMDPRVIKFNHAILKSINKNMVLKQNYSIVFDYNAIVNNVFVN